MKSSIYFHVGAIGEYQQIFNEIYSQIKESGLLNEVESLTIGLVGSSRLEIENNDKIKVHKNSNLELGEFFTLDLLKNFSNSTTENYKVLYLHTKGVTTPNNPCIVDWRNYMTYFNVNQYKECFNTLEDYDSCGVDLVTEPCLHYSGNFWWANSQYIKKLPTIPEIRFPKIPPILSIRHNAEFWIGMKNGKLKSLWDSNINVYERHLYRYLEDQYVCNSL